MAAEPQTHRILTSDGTSLAVSDWTGPSCATVVFLHGLCLDQSAWASQRRHLLRRSTCTRIIGFDHRGHGKSGRAHISTYRIDQLASDLDEVLTALDVRGPLVLVGHSMGAMTALRYLEHGSHAAQVAGMVLVAGAAGNLAAHGAGKLLGLSALNSLVDIVAHVPVRATAALTAPLRGALRQLHDIRGGSSGALAQVVADALTNTPLSTAVGFLTSLRDFDQTHHLTRITILSGGLDLLTPPALSHAMADAIPGATHIHLPTAGHMIPQQESRTVAAAIAEIVESAAAGGGEPAAAM